MLGSIVNAEVDLVETSFASTANEEPIHSKANSINAILRTIENVLIRILLKFSLA
jgi:hypothetical protein